jgi:hypothetical protein
VSDQIQYGRPGTATPLQTAGAMAEDDRSHLSLPVRFGRRKTDQLGHLVFTGAWLQFRGTIDMSVPWSEVARVDPADSDLVVSLHGTRRTLRFSCQSHEDALRGSVTAAHLTALPQSHPFETV